MPEQKPVRLKKDGTPAQKPGPRKGRVHAGRGGFKATEEMRKDVQIAVASRIMTNVDIAKMLNISPMTLYKHFGRELDVGYAQRNFAMLKAQYETGVNGSASAQDKWLKRAFSQPHLGSYVEPEARKAKPKKLGKKEQALEAAHNPDVSTSMGERMARRMAQSDRTRH
jgi:hypothetical protein